MMAHRARVLQGEKTIRMHYANWSVVTFPVRTTTTDDTLATRIMVCLLSQLIEARKKLTHSQTHS
jgi:hypothetical protein